MKKISDWGQIRSKQVGQQHLIILKRNGVNGQKIKIIIQIKDSKRTMKNNSKKEHKPAKKQDKINKKVPAQHRLQQTMPYSQSLAPLQNILSTTTTKLMGGFSHSQKKIISDQFSKMIKKLKIKLVSPQKISQNHGFKLETKTQRFQLADPNNCSKETIKKTVFTDRKIVSPQSPKTKGKVQGKYNKTGSPKRSSTIKSSQCQQIQYNNHGLGSPIKTKKSRFVDIREQNLNQIENKSKKIKIHTKDSKKQNYFLLGERFVQLNQNEVREMQSQVIMEQSSHLKDSQLEYIWSQFKQKKKNSRDRIQSQQQVKSNDRVFAYTPKNSHHLQEQQGFNNSELNNQSIVQENTNFRYSEENKKINEDIYKQFYSDLPSVISPKPGQQKKESNYSIFNVKEGESYSEDLMSPISNKSKKSTKSLQEDVIKTRKNAIELQMKTNRQILTQLLDKNKISKSEFQEHMDLVIEIYDKEMTEIQNLKEMIEMNEQKIDNLIKITNESLKISEKLGEVQVQSVLETVFGAYKKQLQENRGKVHEDANNIFKHSGFLNVDEQPKQLHLIQHKNHSREHVDRFQTQNKKTVNFKHLIETRTALQLSTIKSTNHQGILTSVISVFQFIKNFLSFIRSYHLNQFLTYVNMPYGYSAEQRLRFMQGYDESQENQKKNVKQTGIIYGLEEVFHPNLLNQFHNSLSYKPLAQSSTNSASWKQVQKIHNKLIFDALNQAINRFRPYYLINGCPYLWTTTQKALTYYFISEECYEELFSKVQMQVLKWSSSLCGLLIPEAVNRIQVQDQSKLGLQKIFQKYTVQTECELLEHRQQKIIKQQKIQIYESNFQWNFHDQYKTALLYELSSCILQDISHQMAIFMLLSKSGGQIEQLYYECGVSQSEIEY